MKISNVDLKAIEQNDSNYFLNIGANLYNKGMYKEAMEYYNIAASMNNSHAISNLGYCYLYGRGVEKQEKKALIYFEIAARQNDIDALYKLGTFYLSGIIVEKDRKIAMYFLEKAKKEAIIQNDGELINYPSLCFTLAKECMKENNYDIDEVYDLLDNAKYGYEFEIEINGAEYYRKNYEEVNKILDNEIFDEYKEADSFIDVDN